MIKMGQNDLMHKLEVAQSKVGRRVVASRDTFPDGNGRWYPWFLVEGAEYDVYKAVVNCDRVYLCVERDSRGNSVAVPTEFFRV